LPKNEPVFGRQKSAFIGKTRRDVPKSCPKTASKSVKNIQNRPKGYPNMNAFLNVQNLSLLEKREQTLEKVIQKRHQKVKKRAKSTKNLPKNELVFGRPKSAFIGKTGRDTIKSRSETASKSEKNIKKNTQK